MTLCIAQKIDSMIILASDSRITNIDRYADNAIKVLPLNILIHSARDNSTGVSEMLHSSALGLAFAGTFVAQNAIKDFLAIALHQLQFVPNHGSLTFERICSFIMDLYRHVSNNLCNQIEDQDVIDFFICGICPDRSTVKLAKFSINSGRNFDIFDPQFSVHESISDFPLAIGSGETRFHSEYRRLNALPYQRRAIQALKNVIDDESIPSVGGNIQYGECKPDIPFSVKGIVVPELDKNGLPKLNHFCLGGIDVLDDVFSDMNGLCMTGSFIKPFDH